MIKLRAIGVFTVFILLTIGMRAQENAPLELLQRRRQDQDAHRLWLLALDHLAALEADLAHGRARHHPQDPSPV